MQTFTGGLPRSRKRLLSTSFTFLLLVSGILVVAPQATVSANPGGRIQPLWVQKIGGKITCGSGGSLVTVWAHGSGNIIWYAPSGGSARQISSHGDHIYSEAWHSNNTSLTSWKVESDGYLQDAGTYATCRPPDAPTTRIGGK